MAVSGFQRVRNLVERAPQIHRKAAVQIIILIDCWYSDAKKTKHKSHNGCWLAIASRPPPSFLMVWLPSAFPEKVDSGQFRNLSRFRMNLRERSSYSSWIGQKDTLLQGLLVCILGTKREVNLVWSQGERDKNQGFYDGIIWNFASKLFRLVCFPVVYNAMHPNC